MAVSALDQINDAKELLDAANSSSEKAAVSHIAFIAVCTYVAVIVFGTTHLDLLIGKSITLPLVAVDVSIKAFYAVAPYLIVLVHLNLLIQLQLLSRKLYAFDEAAPIGGGIGGLREQLNIFPYNYYLIGQVSPVMAFFIALLVTITVLLLPIVTLLVLQVFFLAYQSEAITWLQRFAIWLDVIVVIFVWPLIIDRNDSWSAFKTGAFTYFKRSWLRWAWMVVSIYLLLEVGLDGVTNLGARIINQLTRSSFALSPWLLLLWLLLTVLIIVLMIARRFGFWPMRADVYPDAFARSSLKGLRAFFAVLIIGFPLPPLLLVNGEFDLPNWLPARILDKWQFRTLDLERQILLAKPARPEIVAAIRGANQSDRRLALQSIEPINLKGRSLRGANLYGAIMPKADLTEAWLQGAELSWAQLEGAIFAGARLNGAKLKWAQLQDASFFHARLQNAELTGAQLQGTNFEDAQLRGADLGQTQLQGAYLITNLQGANLGQAELQGADLGGARLEGANLGRAQLQGAVLRHARLQGSTLLGAELNGADLTEAVLYTETMPTTAELVDVRGLKWERFPKEELEALRGKMHNDDLEKGLRPPYLNALEKAATASLPAPMIASCHRDKNTQITCKKSYEMARYRRELFRELESLACKSSYIARGLMYRIRGQPSDTSTKGLASRLDQTRKKATASSCPGLLTLTEDDNALLTKLVERENSR